MGVYIHFYVVNIPRFEPFLDQSLASVLLYHLKHAVRKPSDADQPYYEVKGPVWPTRYISYPEPGKIKLFRKDQEPLELTQETVFTDPFLAMKAREYLTTNSSYEISKFLRALEACPESNAVRTVSWNYRRWWIGSFLDYVDLNHYASSEEYSKLVAMFHKVLRNGNCGKTIPKNPYQLSDLEFPVIPDEDIDHYMGVWTPDEVKFFVDLVHRLFEQQIPIFSTPPLDREFWIQHGWSSLELAKEDSEFNEFVHAVLRELLQVETTGFENPAIVSFMG